MNLTLMVACEAIATILSVTGAILVAYNTDRARHWGFRVWVVSNVFWIMFGWLGMTIGVVITFSTYMVCNLIATHRNGLEYQEIKCSCGHRTGIYRRKGELQFCYVHCPCGREIYTK